MFCARCGEQIPDDSAFCQICGREATLKLEPPPPVPRAAPAVYGQMNWPPGQETPFPVARRPELKGIGGWLLFFCISLTVLSPLLTLARLGNSRFELGSLFDLALAALGAVTGVMMWSVHPRAFVFLWIYFGLTVGLQLLGIVSIFLANQGPDNEPMFPFIRGFISILIWFLYFKQSDRVQATFGRNL